jgi:hypothetical protein
MNMCGRSVLSNVCKVPPRIITRNENIDAVVVSQIALQNAVPAALHGWISPLSSISPISTSHARLTSSRGGKWHLDIGGVLTIMQYVKRTAKKKQMRHVKKGKRQKPKAKIRSWRSNGIRLYEEWRRRACKRWEHSNQAYPDMAASAVNSNIFGLSSRMKDS